MSSQAVFDPRRVRVYLVFTFAVGYLMQVVASLLYGAGNAVAGQLTLAAMMFVPMVGTRLAAGTLTGMGLSPRIRGNVGALLLAWFSPILVTAIGAALFFLAFPEQLDLTGGYITQAAGEEAVAALEAQGISMWTYVGLSAVSAVTYAPLVNAVAALGEEAGWRGFLYPQLKARLGTVLGQVVGGVIWGAWHWPVIWLIGYEYGFGYVGFPVTGMLLFCVFTVAVGVVTDWLYTRTGTIWAPAVFHGAVNAAAGIPLLVSAVGAGSWRLLGPAPNGLVAGLPLLALAGALLARELRESRGRI